MKNRISWLILMAFMALSACKKDPCDGISCRNGGSCVNGECACPPGFTGPDCGQLLTPKSVTITSVTVTRFPATTANGNAWDFDSGADIYITLGQNSLILAQNPNNAIINAVSTPISWSNPSGFTMLSGGDPSFCLLLYDRDDLDADDYIDGVCFTPFSSANTGFPESINLSYPGGTVDFTITLDYVF